MKQHGLIWRIFSSFLIMTVTSLILVTWFASSAFRSFYLKQTQHELEHLAFLLRPRVEALLEEGDVEAIDRLCKRMRSEIPSRFTLILADGRVVADSDHDVRSMDNHGDRDEVRQALDKAPGVSVRESDTLNTGMVYVALPILNAAGDPVAVIRASRSLTFIGQALHRIQGKIALGWFVVSLFTGIFVLYLARRIGQPFLEFQSELQRYTRGGRSLREKAAKTRPREIEQLASVLDQMASRLDEHNLDLRRQRHEEEVILSSMTEAVLAVDGQAHILKINRAAAELFHLNLDECRGVKFQEVIRNQDLNAFLAKTLASDHPVVAELVLFRPDPIHLAGHGNRLRDPSGTSEGAVIVLNDVTKLKKLENVRKEFVANVSHELRTPITSIKGFLETLMSGQVSDPKDAKRFLEIAARHTDRLRAIIEDLLSLSKIEQAEGGLEHVLTTQTLRPRLVAACAACSAQAEAKDIQIDIVCPEDPRVRLHASLFEQAVVNLIDNAIKYSSEGQPVTVSAYEDDTAIHVEVTDRGVGIHEKHLPRLFERFYRVNRGRGRELGGTGLGLSIVKHIVQAHGGTVGVTSRLNEGSVFSISLPPAGDGRPGPDRLTSERESATSA